KYGFSMRLIISRRPDLPWAEMEERSWDNRLVEGLVLLCEADPTYGRGVREFGNLRAVKRRGQDAFAFRISSDNLRDPGEFLRRGGLADPHENRELGIGRALAHLHGGDERGVQLLVIHDPP